MYGKWIAGGIIALLIGASFIATFLPLYYKGPDKKDVMWLYFVGFGGAVALLGLIILLSVFIAFIIRKVQRTKLKTLEGGIYVTSNSNLSGPESSSAAMKFKDFVKSTTVKKNK